MYLGGRHSGAEDNTDGGSRWGCNCGAERCRGLLEASFFDLPRELKREYMPFLEDWFTEEHAEEMRRLKEEVGAIVLRNHG